MLRIFSLFLLLPFVFSCKTHYALFQDTAPATSSLNKQKVIRLNAIMSIEKKREVKYIDFVKPKAQIQEIARMKNAIPIIIPPEEEQYLRVLESTNFDIPAESYFNPKPKPKKKKKKNNKKFRQVSSNLFIGIVFLAIAVLMGLFNIPALVGLFGLASIIFLTLGLKKLWKKKRRQNRFKDIFKSKE